MKSNKNESDSLRVTGAFTVRGMTYLDDTIEFDGNIDTLEKLIDDLFKKIENTISKLTNEKYIIDVKETDGKRDIDKVLVIDDAPLVYNRFSLATKILIGNYIKGTIYINKV